jgi:hypothetical protein
MFCIMSRISDEMDERFDEGYQSVITLKERDTKI